MSDKNELAGKVAVVTGAGRNIGRAIALALAQAGAAVVVNVRSNKAEADSVVGEIEKAGGQAAAHIGDVADAKAAQTLAETALARFKRIDILVNNAALRGEKPFDEMSYADWRAVLDVTLDGAFHCSRACLPALKQSGAGAIINIGGMSAHIGSRHRAHVMTAKAGLVGFTRGLAHDLADEPHHRQLRGARRHRHARAADSAPRRRIISPTAPSPASAASRTTLPPWCASSPVPARASSPGRRIHINGGAFLG